MRIRREKSIEGWTTEYDAELDTLYFCKFPLPDDARLYTVEGVSYYVSKNRVVGMMIEYFFTQAFEGLKNY